MGCRWAFRSRGGLGGGSRSGRGMLLGSVAPGLNVLPSSAVLWGPESWKHCFSLSVEARSRGSDGCSGSGCPWLCRARIIRRSASSACGERRDCGVGDRPGAAGEVKTISAGTTDTLCAVGVEEWSSGGVDIGGGLTHGVLVNMGVTQNSTYTKYLTVCAPLVSGFSGCRKDKGYIKDGLDVKSEKTSGCVERRMTVVCFHDAHRHTHTFIHGVPNQALRTERLPVTIWKKSGGTDARDSGGSVLSVPRKSASFG